MRALWGFNGFLGFYRAFYKALTGVGVGALDSDAARCFKGSLLQGRLLAMGYPRLPLLTSGYRHGSSPYSRPYSGVTRHTARKPENPTH